MTSEVNEKVDKKFCPINYQNIKDDEYYINSYKGGEIEPEWNWVKNISIVYTWVDGSDINFLDIKAKYDNGYRDIGSRYRSADELKYSLRSVEKYMPWFNGTIYIVTFNQIPKWLDIKNPRIKIVDHKDIIPEHIYPTFDSNIIELFLDKIPGISERFIYFNDDFFISNYIHPSFFFTSKTYYPKVYRNDNKLNLKDKVLVNKFITNDEKGFIVSAYFTRELIKEYFDSHFTYFFLHHTPFVLYRDLFEQFRQLFKDELKFRCAYRFRSHYKIQTLYLYQVYMEYATQHYEFPYKLGGRGKVNDFQSYSFPKNRTITNYSAEVINAPISNKYNFYCALVDDLNKNNKCFEEIKKNNNVLVFVMNDNYSNDDVLYDFTEFLIEKYPYPSSFENEIYKEIENHTLSKLTQINDFSNKMVNKLPINFDKQKEENFIEVVKENKRQEIKKYVNDKELLSKFKKQISDRETEEIEKLKNYRGEELEEEWLWAKSTSIVYLLETSKNSTNYEVDLFALKYSLRSVEKYLPWLLGNIYIIKPNNIQYSIPWLNVNNDRIKIINQNDFIPEDVKSSVDKHIIELFLDKIPGISEKFIYLNIYHYFKDYVHPSFFFNKDFFPKYNFKKPLSKKEEKTIQENNISLYNTYSIIKKYFGKFYVKMRYLKDAPYTLYRDLFDPVRQLYEIFLQKYIITSDDHKMLELLPLYMISTYNVYGTEQPYYPEYITGFGRIMYAKLPILNKNRTISYYGFDITSPEIAKNIMYTENLYTNNKFKNYKILKNIELSQKIFFSITVENKNNISIDNIILLFKFLNSLYNEKSSFEI